MRHASGKSWKMERASVNKKSRPRAKSNKYSKSDSDTKPGRGSRQRVWVGGYVKSDGARVAGYYRAVPH
jgi:hypothetical protein